MHFQSRTTAAAVIILGLLGVTPHARAGDPGPTTSFTYQGHIKIEGASVSDTCDMRFELWTSPTETDPVFFRVAEQRFDTDPNSAGPPVNIANGLFQVPLDFGSTSFSGNFLWLQVIVGCPSGGGAMEALLPRQEITSAPFAINARRAESANHANSVQGIDGHSLDASDGAPLNALYVNATGQVGIGTLNPGTATTISRPLQAPMHQLELRNEGSIQIPNFDGIRFSQGATGQTTLASIDLLYRNNGLPDLSFSLRNLPNVLFLRAGGNVGINTTTPAARLDVNGDVLVRGNLIQSPRTCTIRRLPYDFRPQESASVYTSDSTGISVPHSAAGQFTVFGSAVHLPNGARVTALRTCFYASVPLHEVTAVFRKGHFSDDILATFVSTPDGVIVLTKPLDHIVVHDTVQDSSYSVEASWTRLGSLANVELRWIELDFETDQICPPR